MTSVEDTPVKGLLGSYKHSVWSRDRQTINQGTRVTSRLCLSAVSGQLVILSSTLPSAICACMPLHTCPRTFLSSTIATYARYE